MTRRPVALLLTAALALGGCLRTSNEEAPPLATASPLPSETSSPDAEPTPLALPSATPSPSPSPSAEPSPTGEPSPSPSPTPEPTPDDPGTRLDEGEALAAADERAASRRECDAGFGGHEVVGEVDGVLVVHIICFFGAYQPNGEIGVWDGEGLAVLELEQWDGEEVVEATEIVGTVEWLDDDGGVGNELRYRGLGDCGVLHTWSFDPTVDTLVLEQAREQECSDDGEALPPDAWPVVYER